MQSPLMHLYLCYSKELWVNNWLSILVLKHSTLKLLRLPKKLFGCCSYVEKLDLNHGLMPICYGNQSAIALEKNPNLHPHTNHIWVKFHYIREVMESIINFRTWVNAIDFLTKASNGRELSWCRGKVLMEVPSRIFLGYWQWNPLCN